MNAILKAIRKFVWIIVLLFVSLFTSISHAQTIVRVDRLNGLAAPTGTPGDSWTNAFKYLQDAIEYAKDNVPAQIWVAAGTYKPDERAADETNGSDLRTDTFRLHNQVAIYAGFAGGVNGETDKNQRDHINNPTILSGAIDTDPNDYSFHVVTADSVSNTAIIDGFTIRDGNAIGETEEDLDQLPSTCAEVYWPLQTGGGMLVRGASPCFALPQIVRCTFESNHAHRGGAVALNAISGHSDGPAFWHCTFRDNTSVSDGGAVYISVPEFKPGFGPVQPLDPSHFYNCLFYSNESIDGKGGAIHAEGGRHVLATRSRR